MNLRFGFLRVTAHFTRGRAFATSEDAKGSEQAQYQQIVLRVLELRKRLTPDAPATLGRPEKAARAWEKDYPTSLKGHTS